MESVEREPSQRKLCNQGVMLQQQLPAFPEESRQNSGTLEAPTKKAKTPKWVPRISNTKRTRRQEQERRDHSESRF
ncbi:predicted protein [Pyrenophora tritici-repentis Pt-1C-BFP]|uniref:Uncharacterized protein n=1 Tax=Pyrenophora tritici-repentis (strain Pt-1C-BFP) TaxID=426418 RepID=B2WIL5_PYRTR|nr:uncharacterized protein PTRG_09824 [Pyrenophora tritici-repentis Pt-1C-BFP]EDU42875.1 predicted protein [Pyrenophora tritici-repentis Pt-1C-BFP]